MPEQRRSARVLGASAAALLAALLAAPAALGQTDEVPVPTSPDVAPPGGRADGRWETSALHAPEGGTLRQEAVAVAGEFHYRRMGPADQIAQATIQVVDDPSDDFTPGGACPLPPPVVVPGTGEESDDRPDRFTTADLLFALEVQIPCNGRYLVQAEARLNDPERAPFTLERSFVLAALPAAVTEVSAKVRDDERKAVVTFTPLPPDQLDPDATGYVVERSGPTADGDGRYDDVGTLGLDDQPRLVDDLAAAEAGSYTYRVRAVRAGADGEVRSSIIDTATADIALEGDPTSPTTTTAGAQVNARGRSIRPPGRITSTRQGSATTRQGPPTTLDTGFEESLDYGDSEVVQELADEPVAGGQSVVRDDDEAVDLAVPAAGALVMLGWAGHIVYLNRLAKQL